jgi:acetyl esterase
MGVALRLRRQATTFALERLFHSLSALGRVHPLSRPERHGLEVTRDVVFAEASGVKLMLDVWRPKTARGAVMYVHGGGFRILSKDTHWIMALMFARAGYVVVNINYRLAGKHPFPAAVEDVARAYAWVLDHGPELGIAGERIAVAGESAGGNLVTGLTIATCFRRSEPWAAELFERGVVPAAVLPACGMLQVSEPERFHKRWPHMSTAASDEIHVIAEEYLRGARSLPPAMLDFADPLVMLERDDAPDRPLPPFLVTCGTRDPMLDDARRLHRALEHRGVRSELHLYPGELHAFQVAIVTPNARRFWRDTYRFLDEHAANGMRKRRV